MRFEQQISASLRPASAAALALVLFASGRPVFASEQNPASPAAQATAAPTSQGPQLRITADEAVRLALENNLGIQAQRLSPQIESLGVAQARAAYAPNLISTTTKRSSANPTGDFLSGTGDVITDASLRTNAGLQQLVPRGGGRYQFTLDASKSTTTRFSNYNPQLGSNFNASYTQPLLRDFRIDSFRQQLLLSKKQEQIADIQLRQQITVTSRNVRSAYYDLVGAIAGLKVAKQSLDLANESLRNNQRRVEVGTMAPIDIIEAQAEVSRNEEQVIVQDGQIRSFEDRLRTLIMNPSQPDFWTVGIEPTEQPTLTPRAVDVDAAVANALANRTDLAQARRQLESTGINLQYARNQKLPAVDLVANYGLVGLAGTQFQFGSGFPPPVINQSQRRFSDALRDVFGNQFKTWSLQLQVSYPIGTSPAEAGLAATRLRQQQQNTDIRELEMQIATSVRDVARQVNTSLKRVEATTKARGFAERRYEAAQKQMSVGLATTFQLFQAQRDLSAQLQAELNAIIAYNRALIDFEAVQTAPIGGR
jgi:outer membrane protein TolC